MAESGRTVTGITPAQATIAGAVIALVAGVLGSLITAWSSQKIETGKSTSSLQIEELKAKGDLDLEKSRQLATQTLEQKRFETSLILEAIKTPNRADAIRNLKFFVRAGFISDPEGRITQLSDESLPSLGPSQETVLRTVRATGAIFRNTGNSPVEVCTALGISPRYVVTLAECIDDKDPDLVFKVNDAATFPLQTVIIDRAANVALMAIGGGSSPDFFLSPSNIREPKDGEPIYMALQLAGELVQMRQCTVVEAKKGAAEFSHDCKTGAGASGAVIFGADDAFLGIHEGTKLGERPVGYAAKLPPAFFEKFLVSNGAAPKSVAH